MENFGNSDDWWISTSSTMKFRDPYDSPEIEKILRDAPQGLDPEILAAEIGVCGFSATHVRAYQRRLGLRPPAVNKGRNNNRTALDTRGRKKPK
jgi:hypothetical protein